MRLEVRNSYGVYYYWYIHFIKCFPDSLTIHQSCRVQGRWRSLWDRRSPFSLLNSYKKTVLTIQAIEKLAEENPKQVASSN
jgi:hypothetical protein